MSKHYVYGPVPSRRLGRSLGVDLVPYKVCSYDCIYCQLGRTTNKTIERKPYIPAAAILAQVCQKLQGGVSADYITLAGSGEPTLNSDMRRLIHDIKKHTDVPVAVLTNASLLGDRKVREAAMEADVVLPSLDAYDQRGFQAINRPHPQISFEDMVQGLLAFRAAYRGEIWLEVFVLEGINASETDAEKFRHWIEKLNPEKVHVNTAVRPAAEPFARQVKPDAMNRFCKVLGKKAEVIAPSKPFQGDERQAHVEEDLLGLLARRPCTLNDMASGLRVNKNEILKYIQILLKAQRIDVVRQGAEVYYRPRNQDLA
jgi:wyosine [tRNA(Phe)-imidazoG37] synthetase (radical SAM superfamily)